MKLAWKAKVARTVAVLSVWLVPGPLIAIMGPEIANLGSEIASSEIAILGLEIAILGPEIAHVGPDIAIASLTSLSLVLKSQS